MDDVNDLISQLEVSPRHLYRLHNSDQDQIFDSSSDEENTSLKSQDCNKPRLYTYDELTQNLAEADKLLIDTVIVDTINVSIENRQEDNKDETKDDIPENITKLSDLIAEVCCSQKELYNQTGNAENIREIFEMQLAKLQLNIVNDATSGRSRNSSDLSVSSTEEFNSTEILTPQIQHLEEEVHTFLPKTAEDIASELGQLVTTQTCFICNVYCNLTSHYYQQSHYNNVKRWLEEQIAQLQQPVDNNLLFCEICNLPLSGNEEARKHYDKEPHVKKAEVLCTVCMSTRCKSKKHLAKAKSAEFEFLNSGEEAQSDDDNIAVHVGSKKEDHNLNDKISQPYGGDEAPSEKELPLANEITTESVRDSEPASPVPVKEYQRLAAYIFKFLDPNYCYICNMSNAGHISHYKTQNHNKGLRKWLEENKRILSLFNIDYLEEIVCIACRTIFDTSVDARAHYLSDSHKSHMSTFCRSCLVHDNPTNHASHDQKASDSDLITIKASLDPPDAGTLLASYLKLMCTPVYCEICRADVKMYNMLYNMYHYCDRSHILMVRRWLGQGMQNLQAVVDPTRIFCEACGVILCGTKLASTHYALSVHFLNQQNYCTACAVRGTPNVMAQHVHTWEHKYNLDKLHKLQIGNNAAVAVNAGDDTVNSKELEGQTLMYQKVPQVTTSENTNGNKRSQGFETDVVSSIKAQIPIKGDVPVDDINIDADETDLYKQLNEEVKILLETLYFSEDIPIKQAVMYMKQFNGVLTENKNKAESDNNDNGTDVVHIEESPRRNYSEENRELDFSDTFDAVPKHVTPIGSEIKKLHAHHDKIDNWSIG